VDEKPVEVRLLSLEMLYRRINEMSKPYPNSGDFGRSKKMNPELSGWICIIIGTLSIGCGGFLTTKGWNLLNIDSRRKALIQAIYQELTYNDVLSSKFPYVYEDTIKDKDLYVMFPLFSSMATENLVASGLFVYTDKKDFSINNLSLRYVDETNQLNMYIKSVNDGLLRWWKTPEARRKAYQSVSNSGIFKDFIKFQKEYLDFLTEKYRFLLPPDKSSFNIKAVQDYYGNRFGFDTKIPPKEHKSPEETNDIKNAQN
jgi:hypothetical protein